MEQKKRLLEPVSKSFGFNFLKGIGNTEFQ